MVYQVAYISRIERDLGSESDLGYEIFGAENFVEQDPYKVNIFISNLNKN